MLKDPYHNNYHHNPEEVEDDDIVVEGEVGDGRDARMTTTMSRMPDEICLQPLRWRLVEGSSEGLGRGEEGKKGALSAGGHRDLVHGPSNLRQNGGNNNNNNNGSGDSRQSIHDSMIDASHPHSVTNLNQDDSTGAAGGVATTAAATARQTLRQSFLRYYETHEQNYKKHSNNNNHHHHHEFKDGDKDGNGYGETTLLQSKPPMVLSDGCIITLTHPAFDVMMEGTVNGLDENHGMISHGSLTTSHRGNTPTGINTDDGSNTLNGVNTGSAVNTKAWTVNHDKVQIVTVDYQVTLTYASQPSSSALPVAALSSSSSSSSSSPPPNYLTIDNDETLLQCLEVMEEGAISGNYTLIIPNNTILHL